MFQEASGGKGANQAVAVARLGCRVGLIARVGQDARGDTILRQLSAEGVDVGHVRRDHDAPTGVALILVDRSGEKQILTALGANRRLTEADIRATKDTIASAKVFLAQLEVPVPAVALGLRLARTAGLTTVLDPAPAVPLEEDVLQLVDVIRPKAPRRAGISRSRAGSACTGPTGRTGRSCTWTCGDTRRGGDRDRR